MPTQPARRSRARLLPLLLPVLAGACAEEAGQPPDPEAGTGEVPGEVARATQGEFWNNLQALCGEAYRGSAEVVEGTDTDFSGELVAHFRECEPDEMRVPFHVRDDRSRTWVLSRTDDGLRLKHDHRHEDGTEDEQTWYGGDTDGAGTATRQDFVVDDYTVDMIPEAETNVWTVEIVPGDHFVYQLERLGTDRLVRIVFDLDEPVETPPDPWGA